jgi:hypothetical protein
MHKHGVTTLSHANKMTTGRIDCEQIIDEVTIVPGFRPQCVKCGLDFIVE